MDPVKAIEVLHHAANIMESTGVVWWLSAGTALGAYRDDLSDEFLERDTDLDVGVLGDQYNVLTTAFVNAGYEVLRAYHNTARGWFGIRDLPVQLAVVRDGIIFDIYFFHPDGDELVSYTEHGQMRKPLTLIENLGSWMGFPMPHPIERYLAIRYGEDWRTPKEKGPWQDQAANLTKI